MKTHPMLFSAPMVRALWGGTKVQHRIPLKTQPADDAMVYFNTLTNDWRWFHDYPNDDPAPNGGAVNIPVAVGDLAWCRETFRGARGYDNVWPRDFGNKPIWYEADGEPNGDEWWFLSDLKRPSAQMPRWASRLTLRVTDVRVQRVQDISIEDACAEGVPGERPYPGGPSYFANSFRTLWNSINGPDSWDRNDWVTALTFDVIKANIDTVIGSET